MQLIFAGAFIAHNIAGLFGNGLALESIHPFLVTLLPAGADSSTYRVHRIHHESRDFWPFHFVHHSVEVTTPVTVYRKHPISDLMASALRGAITGIIRACWRVSC